MRTSAFEGVRWPIAEMMMLNRNLWVWNPVVSLGVAQRQQARRYKVLLSHDFHTCSASATFQEATLGTAAGVAAWSLLVGVLTAASRRNKQQHGGDCEGYQRRTPHRAKRKLWEQAKMLAKGVGAMVRIEPPSMPSV